MYICNVTDTSVDYGSGPYTLIIPAETGSGFDGMQL